MLGLFAAIALDALFNVPTLSGAHIGALVTDAQTGRVMYARDADADFVPASTMKLIVGSAALDRLGTAFSFATTIAADGPTLYIRGGGDVLLNGRDLDDAAASIAALGFTSFSGGLAADISRYSPAPYPDGWQVDDLPNKYAAPVTSLPFADDGLTLTLTPRGLDEQPALRVEPAGTGATLVNDATTAPARSDDTTDLRYDWTHPGTIHIVGHIPVGQRDPSVLEAALLDPPGAVLRVFAQSLTHKGIAVGDGRQLAALPPAARVVWQHHSPRLPSILASMWLPSDNLIAETLLEELGVAEDQSTDTRVDGLAAERTWLQSIGVDPHTVTLGDGSGMSIYDRVTPRALVAILHHDWDGPNRQIVLDALPVAGVRGDTQHWFEGSALSDNVIAKTGSVMHARTLAGYLKTAKGTLIFALMINNWMDDGDGAGQRLRAVQQAFLERIRSDAAGVH